MDEPGISAVRQASADDAIDRRASVLGSRLRSDLLEEWRGALVYLVEKTAGELSEIKLVVAAGPYTDGIRDALGHKRFFLRMLHERLREANRLLRRQRVGNGPSIDMVKDAMALCEQILAIPLAELPGEPDRERNERAMHLVGSLCALLAITQPSDLGTRAAIHTWARGVSEGIRWSRRLRRLQTREHPQVG